MEIHWRAETCAGNGESCRCRPVPRSPGTMGQRQPSSALHTTWNVPTCCIERAEGGRTSCPLGLPAAYASIGPWGGHTCHPVGTPRDWQGTTVRTLLGGLQVTQAAWFSTRRTHHFGGDIIHPPSLSTRGEGLSQHPKTGQPWRLPFAPEQTTSMGMGRFNRQKLSQSAWSTLESLVDRSNSGRRDRKVV